MTAIEIYPGPEQELVLDASDYCAYIRLGDVTIDIPGNSPGDNHEAFSDWLMGFWEQLTDYMAEHADKDHLTYWVRKAAYAIDDEHIVRKEFIL